MRSPSKVTVTEGSGCAFRAACERRRQGQVCLDGRFARKLFGSPCIRSLKLETRKLGITIGPEQREADGGKSRRGNVQGSGGRIG